MQHCQVRPGRKKPSKGLHTGAQKVTPGAAGARICQPSTCQLQCILYQPACSVCLENHPVSLTGRQPSQLTVALTMHSLAVEADPRGTSTRQLVQISGQTAATLLIELVLAGALPARQGMAAARSAAPDCEGQAPAARPAPWRADSYRPAWPLVDPLRHAFPSVLSTAAEHAYQMLQCHKTLLAGMRHCIGSEANRSASMTGMKRR